VGTSICRTGSLFATRLMGENRREEEVKGGKRILERGCADLEGLGTLLVALLSSFDLVSILCCAFLCFC
jgi:hypothetical protein